MNLILRTCLLATIFNSICPAHIALEQIIIEDTKSSYLSEKSQKICLTFKASNIRRGTSLEYELKLRHQDKLPGLSDISFLEQKKKDLFAHDSIEFKSDPLFIPMKDESLDQLSIILVEYRMNSASGTLQVERIDNIGTIGGLKGKYDTDTLTESEQIDTKMKESIFLTKTDSNTNDINDIEMNAAKLLESMIKTEENSNGSNNVFINDRDIKDFTRDNFNQDTYYETIVIRKEKICTSYHDEEYNKYSHTSAIAIIFIWLLCNNHHNLNPPKIYFPKLVEKYTSSSEDNGRTIKTTGDFPYNETLINAEIRLNRDLKVEGKILFGDFREEFDGYFSNLHSTDSRFENAEACFFSKDIDSSRLSFLESFLNKRFTSFEEELFNDATDLFLSSNQSVKVDLLHVLDFIDAFSPLKDFEQVIENNLVNFIENDHDFMKYFIDLIKIYDNFNAHKREIMKLKHSWSIDEAYTMFYKMQLFEESKCPKLTEKLTDMFYEAILYNIESEDFLKESSKSKDFIMVFIEVEERDAEDFAELERGMQMLI